METIQRRIQMKHLKLKHTNGEWEITYNGVKVENVLRLEIIADAQQNRPVANITFFNPEIEIEGDVEYNECWEG